MKDVSEGYSPFYSRSQASQLFIYLFITGGAASSQGLEGKRSLSEWPSPALNSDLLLQCSFVLSDCMFGEG